MGIHLKPKTHKTLSGYLCVNQEGKGQEYCLSRDFKTDVAKIIFGTIETADLNTMLSVLYALLEGLSREMGIERTYIKGCLFSTNIDVIIVYSIVLYEAVAVGTKHIRHIVTENGDAFQRVLKKALSIVTNCDSDSSCYKCLRNYCNQKIYDNLTRKHTQNMNLA